MSGDRTQAENELIANDVMYHHELRNVMDHVVYHEIRWNAWLRFLFRIPVIGRYLTRRILVSKVRLETEPVLDAVTDRHMEIITPFIDEWFRTHYPGGTHEELDAAMREAFPRLHVEESDIAGRTSARVTPKGGQS